jgi:hypothetical protein
MESVKVQIVGKYKTKEDLPDTWNRCPCKIEADCEKKGTQSCNGYVAIELNLPRFSIAMLEIVFFRPQRLALIRKENKQLIKLKLMNIIK